MAIIIFVQDALEISESTFLKWNYMIFLCNMIPLVYFAYKSIKIEVSIVYEIFYTN